METPLTDGYNAASEPIDTPTEIIHEFAGYLESHTALSGTWLIMDNYQREEVLQFLHELIQEGM